MRSKKEVDMNQLSIIDKLNLFEKIVGFAIGCLLFAFILVVYMVITFIMDVITEIRK